MAYDKNELELKSLNIIEEKEIVFLDDLTTYLPCTRGTFYNLELNKLETIKDALETNKIRTKEKLRSKWLKSDNPTLQIALYKLLSNEMEYDKLANKFTPPVDPEKIQPIVFDFG